MKKFLNATNESGEEILVNPEDVHLNKAGTNMLIATYCESFLNKGDKACHYEWFRKLIFDPEEKKTVEKIFLQEKERVRAEKKKKNKGLRRKREKIA